MIITEEASDNGGKKDTLKDLLRLIIFVVLCLLPFLQDKPTYQSSIEREVIDTQGVMTITGYGTAKAVAAGFYNFVMTDMGVYRFLYLALKNQRSPQDKFEEFWAKFLIVSDRIVDNLPLIIYQIGWRLGVAIYWCCYFLPFFLAAIYAGIQHWKLSLEQSSGASVQRFRIYNRAARITVLSFLLYLIVPAAGAAALAKYLVPCGLFLGGVMINKMIASYHKLI